MSHLIPEQRVDKNGVLTTKHVRAEAASKGPVASIPAPKVVSDIYRTRSFKQPSRKQLEDKTYSFSALSDIPDSEVAALLGVKTNGRYIFTANESDVYNLITRMSVGNAIAMLEAGHRSTSDAVRLLKDNGLNRLLMRRNFVSEAKQRRVPVETFVQFTRNISDDEMASDPLIMDALETSCLSSLEDNYAWEVKTGEIRLEDIKAVGVARIRRSDSWRVVGGALAELASGKANYSAADLAEVLQRYAPRTNEINNAIILMNGYGSKFTFDLGFINSELVSLHHSLMGENNDEARNKSIIKYASKVLSGWQQRYGWSRPSPDKATITRFHDANVSEQDFLDEKVTIMQLDAIEVHGISPSVSGGWL